jgi:hypothetical protein
MNRIIKMINFCCDRSTSNVTTNIEESAAPNRWKCDICSKVFDSLYILNYHKLLEHSQSKRPPTGGFKTIAIGRGKDKEDMVKKLGAIHYIDSQSQNVVKELAEFGSSSENGGAAKGAGGAKVILATVPSGKAMSAVLGGLSVNGGSIGLA